MINTVRTPGSNYYKLSTYIRTALRKLSIPTLDLSYGKDQLFYHKKMCKIPLYNFVNSQGMTDEYQGSGWNTLLTNEKPFLVHVCPPGDSFTQAVRELSITMDLATAGILYDQSVGE